jgi:hypothetical protein
MLKALQILLRGNEATLQKVSHLLPPQSLSYLRLLMVEMTDLHLRKAAGYSGLKTQDTWTNFRKAERLGATPLLGVLIRKGDKEARYANLYADAQNNQLGPDESLRRELIDDAAYGLISVCLLDETTAEDGSRQPEGG